MRKVITLVIGLVLTVAVAALLSPSTAAQARAGRIRSYKTAAGIVKPVQSAEPGCKAFVALAHAVLPSSKPLAQTDTWGGPLYATLAGEFLGMDAVLSGNDGEEAWYEDGTVGVGRAGAYTVCTDYPNCANTFTLDVPLAVFHGPADGLISYSAYSVTVVKGTGKFSGASGNLSLQGPANAWLDDASPFGASGRWSAEISGQICGIHEQRGK